MKRILFNTTLQERARISSLYENIHGLLKDSYIVEEYDDYMIRDESLNSADVIVFPCSSGKMRTQEIETISKFIERGGSILVLSHTGGDRGLRTNMNNLLSQFGMNFQNDSVKNDDTLSGLNSLVEITEIEEHDITSGVKSIKYPSGCTISVTGGAVTIGRTSPIMDPPNKSVIALCEHGRGRVICSGAYEMFKDGIIDDCDNQLLAINMFRWLSGIERSNDVQALDSVKKDNAMDKLLRKLVEKTFDITDSIESLKSSFSNIEERMGNVEKSLSELTEKHDVAISDIKDMKTSVVYRYYDGADTISSLNGKITVLKEELNALKGLTLELDKIYDSGDIDKNVYDNSTTNIEIKIMYIKDEIFKCESILYLIKNKDGE